MSGPATTWLKLLLMRCSSLSWDKFTQELLRRFGDTSPPESRVQHDFHTPGTQPLAHVNNTKSHNLNTKPTSRLHPTPAQESAHIKAELIGQRQHDAKTLAPDSQRKYSPPLRADPVLEPAPLLHSSPPPQPQPQFATTPKLLPAPMPPPLPQHQVFPAQSSPDVPHPTLRKLPLPLAIQKPIPPPVLVPLPYPTTLPTPATAKDMLLELRASRVTPPMSIPKFDGSQALASPAPAAEYSTKPEISSPTPKGHHLLSSPPPQPKPQFATTPKSSSAPMPPPLLHQQLSPAQSSPDIPPFHNMELVPQPTPVPALVIAAIHNLEAVLVSTEISSSDARRNRVLHPLPTKHFTTLYFNSQSTALCGQYSANGFLCLQLFSSFHILHGLLFCTLLSSLKHESAPPWLISTIALRARLFGE